MLFESLELHSLADIYKQFPTEEACLTFLEGMRWKNGIESPFDSTSKVYVCSKHRFRCKNTGKYFNVKTHTIFEGTKVALQDWMVTLYLFLTHKKGLSSYQLMRYISVSQVTAWRLLMKLRQAMACDIFNVQMTGIVSADETFCGGKNINRHKDKKFPSTYGRSYVDKVPVVGLLEKGGYLKCFVVPSTKAKYLHPIIKSHVRKGSTLLTDEWQGYKGLSKLYNHIFVQHSKKQYQVDGYSTNQLEGAWSHFKRSIFGIYHKTSRTYLQHYADEFAFRYNLRTSNAKEIIDVFLQSAQTKRPMYKSYSFLK